MGEKVDVRGLFEIYAVNLETDEIVFEQKVVAEGESDALYNSDLKEGLRLDGLKKDDVHIVVREIGPVPKKEKAKTVKILGQVGNLVLGKEKKGS